MAAADGSTSRRVRLGARNGGMGGARADVEEYDGAVGGCREGPPPLPLLLLLLLLVRLAPSATAAGSVLCIAWRESVPALRPFFAFSFSVACD